MDKVSLTLQIEQERLDVMNFYLGKQGGGPVLKELENRLQELYEQAVPEETRGYIDYKLKPLKPAPRSHTKKPASKSELSVKEAHKQDEGNSETHTESTQ